jgi:geranylgeranyl diphosphate synthase type II
MFVKAIELIMQTDDDVAKHVLDLFCKIALQVCEGQQADMDFETSASVSIDDYLLMIEKKTAVLLAASLKSGAVIAHAPSADADHLYEFGKNIGIAFQLCDDLLDVYSADYKFGKIKGGDIAANKKTFLLLKAFELASTEQKEKLKNIFQNKTGSSTEEKVKEAVSIFDDLAIKDHAVSKMNEYYHVALQHLDKINVPQIKKLPLLDFTGELMVREV